MKDLTYRITVQPIGPEESEISEELRGGGVPCSGFVIIGFNDEGSTVAIHHTNMNEIAHAMARSGLLLASAHLGKAIKEATRMQKEDDFSDFLKKLSIRIGG